MASANSNQIILNTRNSVAFIVTDGAICAGALIDTDIVVTSAHCTPWNIFIQLSWFGKPSEKENATLIFKDKAADIAFLKLHTPRKNPIPLADISEHQELETVYAIGHPGALYYNMLDGERYKERSFLVTKGTLARLSDKWVVSDITTIPGNSGGPLLTANGQLLGIVSRVDGQISYATPVSKIKSYLPKIRNLQDPLNWSYSDWNFNGYFWWTTQTFLTRFARSAGINTGEFAIDYRNRVRFSLEFNGAGFSVFRTGWKSPFISDVGKLTYLVSELEFVKFTENPNETDPQLRLEHSATGLSFSLETRTAGVALRFGGYQYNENWEGNLGLGVFF